LQTARIVREVAREAPVDADRDPLSVVHLAEVSACRGADLAESIASTFDQVESTYRTMAEGSRSPETIERLLNQATRLRHRAEHERGEAVRMRETLKHDGSASR